MIFKSIDLFRRINWSTILRIFDSLNYLYRYWIHWISFDIKCFHRQNKISYSVDLQYCYPYIFPYWKYLQARRSIDMLTWLQQYIFMMDFFYMCDYNGMKIFFYSFIWKRRCENYSKSWYLFIFSQYFQSLHDLYPKDSFFDKSFLGSVF